METKAEPLFQNNISLDPNFEVKITLKYICWFSLAAYTMRYISVLSSFTVKKFKEDTIIYII